MSFCQSSRKIYAGLFALAFIILVWGWFSQIWRSSMPVVVGGGRCSSGPKVRVANYNTSWCGYSNQLRPTWSELEKDFVNHPWIEVVDVRCDGDPEHQRVCKEFGIRGFPTILMHRPDGSTFEYNGNRSLDDIREWINNSLQEPHSSQPV